MQISPVGIALIKKFEGFKADAYQDGGGVWTVGYGSTVISGRPVRKGDHLDEPVAATYMVKIANEHLAAVQSAIKVPVTQNQIDAITSFTYNLGVNAFLTSTLLRLLNVNDFAGAAAQFDKWIHDNGKVVNGLITRRAAEKALFLKA
jgi:lysozyme